MHNKLGQQKDFTRNQQAKEATRKKQHYRINRDDVVPQIHTEQDLPEWEYQAQSISNKNKGRREENPYYQRGLDRIKFENYGERKFKSFLLIFFT